MSVIIRPLAADELALAQSIARAAYQSTMDYEPALRRLMVLQPGGWFLALFDGVPAGLVGAINYGPFACVGLMSVLPEMQRRGIGRALLVHVLAWLEEQSCPTVLLDATDAGAALYAGMGFVDDDQTAHWRRSTALFPSPLYGCAEQHITALYLADLQALTAFDAPYFGAGRAAVFAHLLWECPGRAFVARDVAGQITGYLFAQPGQLGPWVARDGAAAEALLLQALALPFDRDVSVLASVINDEASILLERYGFSRYRVLRHMRYGQPALFRRRSSIYGQVSFALG